MGRWRVAAILVVLGFAHPAWALPTGDQVIRQVRGTRAGLRDYTVDVDIHVAMEGVKIPDISVRVFHKAPDKTKLQPLKGFAIIPKGTILPGDPFAALGEHFTAKVLGTATVAGRPAYHLGLRPRGEERPEALEAWVDRERWTVLRLGSRTPSGDAISLEMAYQQCKGGFWLPARTVAHVKLPNAGPRPGGDPDEPHLSFAGQKGTVTATFRGYKINTGLSDSLFKEEAKRPARRHRHGR